MREVLSHGLEALIRTPKRALATGLILGGALGSLTVLLILAVAP